MSNTIHNNSRSLLFTIFFTVFLDLLGVGIALPVTAPLLLNPYSGLLDPTHTEAYRTIMLGFLVASFPMATFFGSPLLGALSDRYGRKLLLLLSLVGTCIGYLIFAWGIYERSLPLLFLSRIIDGFTGGNISIIQSAIADVSDPTARAKNFGLIGMAFGLGFILGPYLGGKLADPSIVSWFGFDTPFLVAAALAALNIILVVMYFTETLAQPIHRPIDAFTGFRNIAEAFNGRLALLFAGVFFVSLGFNFYTQFFQVFLIKKLHFNQSQIGDYFAYVGICVALVQGILVRRTAGKWQSVHILQYSLPCLSLALLSVLLPTQAWHLYLTAPFIALSQGMSAPNITTLVSQQGGAEQGKILGINQSVLAVAMALPPIIAAFIDLISVNLPIIAASSFVLLGWVFILQFGKRSTTISLIS